MVIGSKHELRRVQRALENLLSKDLEGNAQPPLDSKARHETFNALEAIDRALAKLEGTR